MSDNNTHFIQITGTVWGNLDIYPRSQFKDGFFFKNVDLISTFNYPTTTFFGILTSDQPIFTSEISGGPLKDYSYEDFSNKRSFINLGLYYCTPTIVVSLSSFEETVSPVVRIVYDNYGQITALTPSLCTSFDNFALISPKNIPLIYNFNSGDNYITTLESGLSVFRLDGTVNTFTLYTSVVQCGLLEVHDSINIINSQILDKSNLVLLTIENPVSKSIYNSILDTNIPFVLRVGQDEISLTDFEPEPPTIFELEAVSPTPSDVFIAEQIRQLVGIQDPIIPLPPAKINPITPIASEYFYRGLRGITIRPLLARLLPREEFFFASPGSGLIIQSGGAPYAPGRGINFQTVIRTLGF